MINLIGSRALALRAPRLLRRQPKDFDFVGFGLDVDSFVRKYEAEPFIQDVPPNKSFYKSGETMLEFEHITPGESSELLAELVAADHVVSPFGRVPSLDLLFTIKQSHRYKKNSPHFWKNLGDWHAMRAAGAKVRPEFREFLKLREKETYAYKHPSLNQSKAGFFGEDQNKYKYDHDSIHEAVTNLRQPAYRFFQKEEAEVACSKDKFFACSRDIQLLSVVEESAVLAIERSLVPHAGKLTPKAAWLFALSKCCTSIASGWWRQFAYENALEIITMYPENFYEKFQAGVASGVVREAA